MISNHQNTPPQTKQRQLKTCLRNTVIRNSSITFDSKVYSDPSLESTSSEMSTLTAAVAVAAANKNQLDKPSMEAVVVNSIIYSKPSFCGISVDLGGHMSVGKNSASKEILTNRSSPNNIKCFGETICHSSIALRNSDFNFDAASCFTGLTTATSALNKDGDAKLYRMCTTINGSIQHQISDMCDNIFAMAGLFGATNNEHDDDDSFIDFAYRDDDDYGDRHDEDDDDEADFAYDEDAYDYEADDDNDVVDFSYDCLIEPAPKFNCDRKKKVRFNTQPTVHIMHTWKYAYHAARKGEWEMYARDRERFKLRIQRTALILDPILEREHRQKIYENRFANICEKDDRQNEVSNELKSNEALNNIESKKPHQKKKRRKRRFCKMGNKHYF